MVLKEDVLVSPERMHRSGTNGRRLKEIPASSGSVGNVVVKSVSVCALDRRV